MTKHETFDGHKAIHRTEPVCRATLHHVYPRQPMTEAEVKQALKNGYRYCKRCGPTTPG